MIRFFAQASFVSIVQVAYFSSFIQFYIYL